MNLEEIRNLPYSDRKQACLDHLTAIYLQKKKRTLLEICRTLKITKRYAKFFLSNPIEIWMDIEPDYEMWRSSRFGMFSSSNRPHWHTHPKCYYEKT